MNWNSEALLFGGEGDGYSIRVPSLHPTVTVFKNGGAPFAVEGIVNADAQPDAKLLGTYGLATPLGPDTAVYVADCA